MTNQYLEILLQCSDCRWLALTTRKAEWQKDNIRWCYSMGKPVVSTNTHLPEICPYFYYDEELKTR